MRKSTFISILNPTSQIGATDGSASSPAYSFSAEPTTGIFRGASGQINFSSTSSSGGAYAFGSFYASSFVLDFANQDIILRRKSAMNPQWGTNSATPSAHTHDLAPSSRSATDTNVSGANATIQPGTGTGNATPSTLGVSAPALGTASGTTAQTIVKRHVFNATKTGLSTGSATSLVDIALTTLGMAGGQVNYLIEATDGTDMCTTSGSINYASVNKGGVYTQQVSSISNLATACSAGTLTAAWSLVSGSSKTTLKVTPTLGTVVATTFRITYEISHYGQQDITIL